MGALTNAMAGARRLSHRWGGPVLPVGRKARIRNE